MIEKNIAVLGRSFLKYQPIIMPKISPGPTVISSVIEMYNQEIKADAKPKAVSKKTLDMF
jgi:hypothetical protein